MIAQTIAGDDEPVAIMERDWFRAACAAPTARAHIEEHVQGTRGILERVAPIMPLLAAAAATDSEIAAQWPDGEEPRYAVQHAAAEAISRKPDARHDLTATAIGDLLFGLLSPQLYLLFVRDRGWSPEDWQDWVRTTLTDQICDQVSPRKTPYSHRPGDPRTDGGTNSS